MHSVEMKAIDINGFDIWFPLWKGYQRFYVVEILVSATLKTWARFLDPVEPMHAALAMVSEQAFGLVRSIFQRSTLDNGRPPLFSRPVCYGRCAWHRHRARADRACPCGCETSLGVPVCNG